VASVDAYRGFVMVLLIAQALQLPRVARAFPDSPLWQALSFHQSHVEWAGCSLHDLIQPSFSFLVGVALPFSLAGRAARGQSMALASLHAAWRAGVLVLLGVFLRSIGQPRTNWTFEDTLSQIGLGYLPLFLMGRLGMAWTWGAVGFILLGYWAAFALYPLPGTGFDYPAVGVPHGWPYHYPVDSFEAHWNKNSNPAWAFDTWFLNLFPREKPFTHNGGGYSTLSFIPTLATMLLGLVAGRMLRAEGPEWGKALRLAGVGAALLAAGWGLGELGVCPVVKKIWTPTWTLYSGGLCFLLMAGFHLATDAVGWRAWALPLTVAGANSIAAYVMAGPFSGFVKASFATHFGPNAFAVAGPEYEPLLRGGAVMAVLFAVLTWMYRRGIFVRV
jgi:predicted acyltransferase